MKPKFFLVSLPAISGVFDIIMEILKPFADVILVSKENLLDMIASDSAKIILIDASTTLGIKELIQKIIFLRPESHVYVLTTSPNTFIAREVLRAGASDYINILNPRKEINNLLHNVLHVDDYISIK